MAYDILTLGEIRLLNGFKIEVYYYSGDPKFPYSYRLFPPHETPLRSSDQYSSLAAALKYAVREAESRGK